MRHTRFALPALLIATLLGLPLTSSAQAPDFPLAGDWEGTLVIPQGELPVIFHITLSEDGTFASTLDSPAQQAFGIPMDSVIIEDGTVRISAEALQGGYTGKLADDKTDEIDGTWEQMGQTLPLKLTRVAQDD